MFASFRTLVLLSAALTTVKNQGLGDSFGDKNEKSYDLLRAAEGSLKYDPNVIFDVGLDDFPAFRFKPKSEVIKPFKLFLPEKLPAEFTLVASFKPLSTSPGYLFGVLNSLDTVVQLGLRISSGPGSNQNITLLYTNSDLHSHADEVATFTVNRLIKKWSEIVVKVTTTEVTLYLNCHEFGTQKVTRIPSELVFDNASKLYLGQAGPNIKGNFDGSIQTLKLYSGYPPYLVECNSEIDPITISSLELNTDTEDSDPYDLFPRTNSSLELSTTTEDPDPYDLIDILFRGDDDSDDGDSDTESPPRPPPPPPIPGAIGPKGEPGVKGEKGEGIRGEPGQRGPQGPPGISCNTTNEKSVAGPPGLKGDPGTCFCNTSAILASFTTPKLIQGEKGDPGPPGKDGAPGAMGFTGAVGKTGERGQPGPEGTKGERGASGEQGPEGPQGVKGAPGRDGVPGEKGAVGPPGPPGKGEISGYDMEGAVTMRPGLPGKQGAAGTPGNPGPKGEPGVTGAKGSKGEGGHKGSRGDHGKEGPKGTQGFKGEIGATGASGRPGAPGENARPAEKGSKGDSGPEGKMGPPGPPGPPGQKSEGGINVGEICEKGDKGEPGQLGFKGDLGPKGEKGGIGDSGPAGIPGIDGIQGPQGNKGDPGKDGTPGSSGIAGSKGERGEKGPPGVTAIAAGPGDYVTIKGEKGKRGRPGKQGPKGRTGDTGLPGLSGRAGMTGLTGNPGDPGVKGEKGDAGAPSPYGHAVGVKGDKGDSGMPGSPGRPGRDGQRGPPGPAGPAGPPSQGKYIPVPGPPGPPGPPGSPGISLIGQKGEPGIGRSHIFGERTGDNYYGSRQGSGTISTRGPPESTTKIVPGAVTFQNTDAMTKMSAVSQVGTLAYIIDEEALLVRVNSGWQYIALGSLLPITTPAPPTTAPPPVKLPLEMLNMINPMKSDGTGLRMAAINEPITGDIHGIRGADYACYRQSRRAGFTGSTFRAFLSSRVQNVDSIVRYADRDLPIVNIKGDVLFNSWKEMFKGDGAYFSQSPRIYSFNGKNILTDFSWAEKVAWHGSHKLGDRAMDTYCDAWHSSSPDRYGLGSPLNGDQLLEQVRYSCDNKFALLCIEVTTQMMSRRRRDVHGEDFIDEAFDDDYELSIDEYTNHLDKLMREN